MKKNKIYNTDVLKGLKQLETGSVDLIVTSPPYNIGMEYDVYDDNKEWKDYYLWCSKWLKECFRVLKEDGRLCLNHYISLGTAKFRTAPLMELNTITLNIGFKHHSVVIWMDRTLAKRTAWGSWLSASAPYINSPFEGILILYKNQWKKLKKGENTIKKKDFIELTRGIWNIPTERKQLTKANFPIELPLKCIDLLSYEKDLIVDIFMGSGTTAMACKQLNRKYIGFEISERYCKIANERLSQRTLNKSLNSKKETGDKSE